MNGTVDVEARADPGGGVGEKEVLGKSEGLDFCLFCPILHAIW